MAIGPFSTYAPPGVYTQTSTALVSNATAGGVRIPFFIGTGRELLSQTGYELIRGSSSSADTPIFNEDAASRWVSGGTPSAPTLSEQTGSYTSFQVRNRPIVDGSGSGLVTFSTAKVSVTVNGSPVAVTAVDGTNGIITLLVPPARSDVVSVNYYFHRKDTRAVDDVGSQVTAGVAVLVTPKPETYNFTTSNNVFKIYVNDSSTPSLITLGTGSSRYAADVAADINAAGISGLSATVTVNNQGLSQVSLASVGNLRVGDGTANGMLGFSVGTTTVRNRAFRVFNGPITDGSDGGLTTNDPSKVTVTLNGVSVIASVVDGKNRLVTLPYAPASGAVVSISYYYNSWQDTFDYLPNGNVTNVISVGIGPGRRDYVNGRDFVVQNVGTQSFIQWGTSFSVTAGVRTGAEYLDSSQIVGTLVDDRLYGVACERATDSATLSVSETVFLLPKVPTSGNGRDTPLGINLFQSVTNGRIDLPTDRPELVTVYVGRNFRDAYARPAVSVLAVDGASRSVTLKNPVPADYKVYATFWYNQIQDSNYTFSVVAPGPTGVGTYTVTSSLSGSGIYSATFGGKTGVSETLNWPGGYENDPGAFHDGSGTAVAETVNVSFDSALAPATHASITNAKSEPYDLYDYTSIFGDVVVDGNTVSVDLTSSFTASLIGAPVSTSLSFLTTDVVTLLVDGITIESVSLSACADLTDVAAAINVAIDASVAVHADGTATFFDSSPNNVASVVTFGSQECLRLVGRNDPTISNGEVSSIGAMTPTTAGMTNAAGIIGLTNGQTFFGAYNALNKPAEQISTKAGAFDFSGSTNLFTINVDGAEVSTALPTGASVSASDVVAAVNESYLSVASAADIAAYTNSTIDLANSLRTKYAAHRVATSYHDNADTTNVVSVGAASTLGDAIALLNAIKTAFNTHRTQSTVHQLTDTSNVTTSADATNLTTAVALAYELKKDFNNHLMEMGVHGHDDALNDVSTADASDQSSAEDLANDLKSAFNLHIVYTESHYSADTGDTVTAPDATNLSTVVNLANDLKTSFNDHRTSADIHVVNDTTNVVNTADASNLPTAIALLNDIKVKYNDHLEQVIGSYHVHGTDDTTNAVSVVYSGLIAYLGQGINAGKLVLRSRTNTPNSNVTIRATSTSLDVLGFVAGKNAIRVQPTAALLTSALCYSDSFSDLVRTSFVTVSGLGTYINITSLTAGSTSTISFSSTTNTAFLFDTNLGITPGVTGDIGENALSGFHVTSNNASGSSGMGIPGQTYTDGSTGLTFSLLPSSTGDYTNGGSFTLNVSPTFTANASVSTRSIPGVEVTVYNLVNTATGTTAVLTTYPKTGSEPSTGDVYYITYDYTKFPEGPAVFTDFKSVQQNYGPATPDYPISLAARLAFLNGSPIVGIKQVFKAPGSSQATPQSYVNAIDELKKPIGNVKPAVITCMTSDSGVIAYLSQHVAFMSTPRQEGERVAVVGTAVGTTPSGVQSLARGLNSELVWVVYPDSFVISTTDELGNTTDQLIDGTYAAAAIAATTCSPVYDVASPLTRRPIVGFKSLGRYLDPTEANQIAVAGVSVIEQVDAGLRVRHGLTSRPENVLTRTPSVTLTIQYVQQTLRSTLDPYIGQKFTGALIKTVEGSVLTAFNSLITAQIVNKLGNYSVTVDPNDPTVMRVDAAYVPVFPLEYIVVSLQVRVSL